MNQIIDVVRALLRKLAVAVFKGTTKPIFGSVCRLLVNLTGRRFGKLKLFDDHANMRFKLLDASNFETVTPRFLGKTTDGHSGRFPAVSVFQLRDATISTDTSNVIVGNSLLTNTYCIENIERIPVNSRMLGYADNNICIINDSSKASYERGILVDGDGGSNWYHFLIECLPKAMLAEQLPSNFNDFPLIVPPSSGRIRNFADAIALFSGNRSLIHISPHSRARVRELVVMEDLVHAPFNLHKGMWPEPGDYAQHDDFLKEYARQLRKRLGLDGYLQDTPKRIFLWRPGTRRDYNQEALMSIASKYGFEAISPEKLSLKEQSVLFANAEFVVGASGAAWANMVFRKEPMRGLCWLFEEYRNFSTYSTLAHLLGHRLEFIAPITRKKLKSTAEAYTADYKVPEREFEDALVRILHADT